MPRQPTITGTAEIACWRSAAGELMACVLSVMVSRSILTEPEPGLFAQPHP